MSRHPWLLWVGLLALIVFVWSSANMGVGIWSEQRRRLVPWLLIMTLLPLLGLGLPLSHGRTLLDGM